MKCGLLGEKLGHSRSPEIHAGLGSYEYKLIEKTPEEVESFLKNGDYDAINVTIPYKRKAFSLCDAVSPIANKLGNCNVVVKGLDGKLFGDNTDAYGFACLVEKTGVDVKGKKCVVLGSGGAATTAAVVLRELGADPVVNISRSGEDNYTNLSRHQDAALVVNGTPVGMFPKVDFAPVSMESFPKAEAVIDLIYNPEETMLLADAKKRGKIAVGGWLMLVEQAKKASSYMNANLYFYGAPGSGKSTLGKKYAEKRGVEFIDLDEEIEKREGTSIPTIFAEKGEKYFRDLEAATLLDISKTGNKVVSLGGGTLLRDENRRVAEATGRVIYIDATKEDLVARAAALEAARPLLKGGAKAKMEALLAARWDHYQSFTEKVTFKTMMEKL